MAGWVPLEVEQWSTFSRIITVKTDDGLAQNLSGYVVSSQMRKSYDSLTAVTLPASLSDASNGEITLAMTSANTGNVSPGRYLYDVVTTSPGGVVQRLIEGIVVVSAGVTH